MVILESCDALPRYIFNFKKIDILDTYIVIEHIANSLLGISVKWNLKGSDNDQILSGLSVYLDICHYLMLKHFKYSLLRVLKSPVILAHHAETPVLQSTGHNHPWLAASCTFLVRCVYHSIHVTSAPVLSQDSQMDFLPLSRFLSSRGDDIHLGTIVEWKCFSYSPTDYWVIRLLNVLHRQNYKAYSTSVSYPNLLQAW